MAEVKHFVWERFGGPQLKGCQRAAFLLYVPDYVFDLYFNSPVGYRAQYARSIATGEEANRSLLSLLSPRLLAKASSPAEGDRILHSLNGAQAKTWIDESEVESHLLSDEPEINYPPWAAHQDCSISLRAPVGTRIVVLGGWLDAAGSEALNPLKASRSQELHEYGFS